MARTLSDSMSDTPASDQPTGDSTAPTEDPRPDGLRSADSVVVVNTGNGKGKSSSAFGIMIRGVARGWNVAVVQFIKSGDWKVGEQKIGRQLGLAGFQAATAWHDSQLAEVNMWPAFLPGAFTPSWQLAHPLAIPACENVAGVQATVAWQELHSPLAGIWLMPLPVAFVPS